MTEQNQNLLVEVRSLSAFLGAESRAQAAYRMWDKTPGRCEETPVLKFFPAEEKKTTATVVIFPGGGYVDRAPHEGDVYARFLNRIGMDAFVLEYRVAPHRFPLELLDARRSVRCVREGAAKFDLDPDRVAVMGSSAGGHLAALVSTYPSPIEGEGADEIDRQNPIPNGTILCYPVIHMPDESKISHEGSYLNLLGPENMEKKASVSPDLLVNGTTPPAFLWHTSDDGAVNVVNSYRYGEALRKAGIPHEMHIFPNGYHGMGLAEKNPHVGQWTGLLKNWFVSLGWLP